MADLNRCFRCGGDGEYYEYFSETDFGDKRFVGIRCKKCKATTSRYMMNSHDPKICEIIEDLWNRGRVDMGDNDD